MKFYKTDWFLRVASLLIAIILWFYVVYQENPVYSLKIKNVPIVMNNISKDFDNGKLVILSDTNQTADIKVSGRRRVVSTVSDRAAGNVYVDMSNVTEAGEYTLPVNVNFGIDGVDVVQIKPDYFKVKVDKVVTAEREIEVNTKGALPEGYAAEGIVISPTVVKLTGAQSVIDTVNKCSISVELTDVTDDIKGLYKIKLYDVEGEEITDVNITKNVEYTDVYCSVAVAKSVPVSVNVSSDRNAYGKRIIATADPQYVLLKGKTDVLESLEKAETEKIDVSLIKDPAEIECSLVLPTGVLMTEDKKIKVKIDIEE